MEIKKYFKRILIKFASLGIFFWSMIWLMIITTIGTIEQKNIGLFASQEKYFSSIYFQTFGIPLPGGGAILILITIGLIAQLIFKTDYKSKKKRGVLLTHVGAIILLIGSFITYFSAVEGSLILKEGEEKSYILDYKTQEIAIIPIIEKNNTDNKKETIKAPFVSSRDIHSITQGLSIVEIMAFPNCLILPNQSPAENEIGFAKMFKFSQDEKKKSQEICSQITLMQGSEKRIYRVFLNMEREQTLSFKDKTYLVKLINKHIDIPFSVQLIDFEKKFHQGTMISKSFKSYVQINDGALSFKRIIEMNAPLRYKGYTFYQSSFSENSEGEMSELAVVKNHAQWFPYFSSLILSLGILLHLLIKLKEKEKEKEMSKNQ